MSDFTAIADGLKTRLGIDHVSVCFLAAAKPTLDEGLEAISQNAGRRVIAEISQKISMLKRHGLDIIHTSPLSSHQIIEDIVIYRAVM